MSGAGTGGPTVLVAESSRTLATLIRLTLQADGYRPVWVSSGREALNEARLSTPTLAIVDAGLHDLGGYDLADALRAHPPTAQIPILLLHHDYDPIDRSRLERAGVGDVMAKPFERQALLTRVRALAPHSGNAVKAEPAPAEQARLDRLADMTAPQPDPRSVFERSPQSPPHAHAVPPQVPTTNTHQTASPRAASNRAPVPGSSDARASQPLSPTMGATLATVPSSFSAQLRAAIDQAVTDAMQTITPRLERLLDERLQQALDTEVRQLVKNKAETIVWKTVGELTEDLIREEIKRLTSSDS